MDLYKNSWKLYKAHTESFHDDFEYYYNFCKGKKSLELFAGFGRITNYLIGKNIDIESVELNSDFAKFIKLDSSKNHVCDVLEFHPENKYSRIFAGYNSFCLFTKDQDAKKFFKNLDQILDTNGLISLSYFSMKSTKGKVFDSTFKVDTETIQVKSYFTDDNNLASWTDEYYFGDNQKIFKYPVKLYEEKKDIEKMLQNTNLYLKDIIYDYNLSEPSENGWIEYLIAKK